MAIGFAVSGGTAHVGSQNGVAMGDEILDQEVEIGGELRFRTAVDVHNHRPGPSGAVLRFIEPGWDLPFVEGGEADEFGCNERGFWYTGRDRICCRFES